MTLSAVIAFLIGYFGLGIMIGVHELGHFISARICGIRVEKVSLGFGPALFKWQNNETLFQICIIPIGGSTQMAGRDDIQHAIKSNAKNMDSCEDGSIYSVNPIKRIITYISGPLANIIFAILCYVIYLMCPIVNQQLSPAILLTCDAEGEYRSENCAARDAGLVTGDIILSVNGRQVETYDDLSTLLSFYSNEGQAVLTTENGSYIVKTNDGLFGILPLGTTVNRKSKGIKFLPALKLSVKQCILETESFVKSLIGLFQRKEKVSQTIGGTIKTSQQIGLITQRSFRAGFNKGIRSVLYILASVSVSMGFANMLPITALDGGLILISVIELFTKRTWSPKLYVALQTAGLVFIFIIIPILKLID